MYANIGVNNSSEKLRARGLTAHPRTEFPTHSRSNYVVINCAVKTEGKIVRVWGPLDDRVYYTYHRYNTPVQFKCSVFFAKRRLFPYRALTD
jgi:hypothetical protein